MPLHPDLPLGVCGWEGHREGLVLSPVQLRWEMPGRSLAGNLIWFNPTVPLSRFYTLYEKEEICLLWMK